MAPEVALTRVSARMLLPVTNSGKIVDLMYCRALPTVSPATLELQLDLPQISFISQASWHGARSIAPTWAPNSLSPGVNVPACKAAE
eukprot:5956872-Prymnesium_polylepis.2